MKTLIKEIPKAGSVARLRIVAKNWENPNLLEQHGMSKRNIRLIKQKIKQKYPEFLRIYNPIVAEEHGLIRA